MYIERFYLEACIAQRSISKWYVKSRTLKWWNYYVDFVQGDEQRFKSIFKLPLSLFENLFELLRQQLQQGKIPESFVSIQGRVLSVEKQVAIGIFCLAAGTSTMAISELFGARELIVVETINQFVHAFLVHQCKFIAWPRILSQINKAKAGFLVKQGLPNVCGAMDAMHIVMERLQGELGLDWYD
ncbi:hypothetical protein L7F22_027827 [Adiantum nelumboides]|nr:hypothetical protein [Adiantum nelumboides]